MNKLDDLPEWVTWLLVAGVLVAIIFGCYTLMKATSGASTPTPEVQNDCMIFPNGWELISRDSYAYAYSGPAITYICRNIQTKQYRQCTPQIVACDEGK